MGPILPDNTKVDLGEVVDHGGMEELRLILTGGEGGQVGRNPHGGIVAVLPCGRRWAVKVGVLCRAVGCKESGTVRGSMQPLGFRWSIRR